LRKRKTFLITTAQYSARRNSTRTQKRFLTKKTPTFYLGGFYIEESTSEKLVESIDYYFQNLKI
jgi:hypothetical protein